MLSKKRTKESLEIMGEMFPEAKAELKHQNPFELLIAVMLSAQATDISVNKVTPELFKRYPNPLAVAESSIEEIIPYVKSIGLFRNKAKHIFNCCQLLLKDFNGKVPQTRAELVSLPGVGRKTANVVLADAFGVPAMAVDTHVERVTKRLNIVAQKATVLEVEETLMTKLPEEMWIDAHHRLIFFGRYHCTARQPKCSACPLLDWCPDGQKRMKDLARK